jgi:hypothetical protein
MTARIEMQGFSHPRRFEPFPGESASGFVIRLSQFLSFDLSGPLFEILGDPWASASAVHLPHLAGLIAEVAGISPQALLTLFALPDGRTNCVRLGSFTLRSGQVDQSTRRVAPAVFASDIAEGRQAYHRLVWSVSALRFDPESGHALVRDCDRCGAKLLWTDAFDVGQCGTCTRRLWLTDTSKFEPNTQDLLLSGVFSASAEARTAGRSKLPFRTRTWTEGEILDLLDVVGTFEAAINQNFNFELPATESTGVEAILAGEAAIRKLIRSPIEVALKRNDRLSPILASGATSACLRRAPSKIVSDYLLSLVV